MSVIQEIFPYEREGIWIFDDPAVGLSREPFIRGADKMIDKAVGDIPSAVNGFVVAFSDAPFPGHHITLQWRRAESAGDWYFSPELQQEGWLSAALLKYFAKAPQTIYAQVRPK